MSSRNKKRRSKSLRAVAVVYFAVIFASSLTAATDTVNFTVTATVVDVCTVTPTFTGFGNLNSGNETDAQGKVTIMCTSDKTGTTIAVGGGGNEDSTQRRMEFGGNYVPYDIYESAGRNTKVNPDATFSPFNHSALSDKDIIIYLRAPDGSYTAGQYTDTLDILVTYSE